MFYLLWSLLNIGLTIFFLFICFKATKPIKEKIGVFGAVVFVLALFSFMTGPNKNDPERSQAKKWTFYPEDSTLFNKHFSYEVIDENLGFALNIGISFFEQPSTKTIVAAEGHSIMTGITSGYTWRPAMISVNPTNVSGQFLYTVHGTLEWQLLGIKLYSQPKDLSGTIKRT
jgi:hypothetical protein